MSTKGVDRKEELDMRGETFGSDSHIHRGKGHRYEEEKKRENVDAMYKDLERAGGSEVSYSSSAYDDESIGRLSTEDGSGPVLIVSINILKLFGVQVKDNNVY